MKYLYEIIAVLIIGVAILYTVYVWDLLPLQVPTHFDLNGIPNGWTKKGTELLLIPLIGFIPIIILSAVKHSLPSIKDHPKTFRLMGFIQILLALMIGLLHYSSLQMGMGKSISFMWIPMFFIGAVFAITGNAMKNIKPNPYIGIRTSWTLNNEIVWKRTHDCGAKYFFFGGLILCMISFLPLLFMLIFGVPCFLIILLYPLYKSWQFKIEEENKNKLEINP